MRPYRGRQRFDIVDPLVEPLWSGTRVLAHVAGGPGREAAPRVALIEELGADLAEALPDLSEAIATGALVVDAIIDGIITPEVALDGVGAAAIPEVRDHPARMLLRNSVDFDVAPPDSVGERGADLELVDGFVAVDLLRIDGTSLLDVPLLERKRLLEGIIVPGPLLRVSSHVRPPWDPWIATWKSVGLRGGMLKAANSRYHPNDDTIEWKVVERLSRR